MLDGVQADSRIATEEVFGPVLSVIRWSDLLPGPLTEAIAERMLHIVVEELLSIGAEVTAVRIEVRGPMATW